MATCRSLFKWEPKGQVWGRCTSELGDASSCKMVCHLCFWAVTLWVISNQCRSISDGMNMLADTCRACVKMLLYGLKGQLILLFQNIPNLMECGVIAKRLVFLIFVLSEITRNYLPTLPHAHAHKPINNIRTRLWQNDP